MQYTRTGIVLCTENYKKCVEFYTKVMELPVIHILDDKDSKLTSLDLGGNNYLMIETGGESNTLGKTISQSPVWLRFNVENIDESVKILEENGLLVNVRREVWGTIADFLDPDGNRCSLREESTFG